MNKILSIIIPTYNMEKYLDNCLSSLIISEELLDYLDVMVINDGSKDCSVNIAQKYVDRFPSTFRVINKENGNYGSCVNVGLKEAKGEYVKILDADDSFDTYSFNDYVSFLLNTDADAVINDMCKVTDDGQEKDFYSFDFPSDTFPMSEFVSKVDTIWMHCVAYKTQNLRAIGYEQTEGISYTDQEWIFLPMAFSNNLAYFKGTVYRYLVGREGQTINPKVWNKNFWQELKGLRVMFDEFRDYSSQLYNDQRQYLRKRLLFRTNVCYISFFITFDSMDNYQLMVEFDQFLKEEDKEIYLQANKLHFTRYHYVKAWREKNYPKQMPILKILKLIRKFPLLKYN